ncbi:MAG: alpha/beta fold hydrolase [Bradymonadia bacterium]
MNRTLLMCLGLTLDGCAHSSTAQVQDNDAKAANAPSTTDEETTAMTHTRAIEDTLDTIFHGVDQHRWAAVEGAMQPTVHVNYADLGGPSGAVAAKELVGGWSGFLPRFTRTAHQLSDVSVHIAGERATATFDGVAVHMLPVDGEMEHWTVFAGYDTEFERVGGVWKLARIDLALRDQSGRTDLPALAMKATPQALTTAAPHPTVEAFFKALEQQDLTALGATFADDVVQQMPLAPKGFPKTVEGKDNLTALFGNIIDHPQRYTRTYHATGDDLVVLVRMTGEVQLPDGPYRNHYVNVIHLNDSGRIERIVEHFNPRILLASWPGLSAPHHSVHASGAAIERATMTPVRFKSGDNTLEGHLFTPKGFDGTGDVSAVIVAGSWTSVKGQMPDVYASRLAAEGYVALTFDFTGFGDSEGAPRQLERPAQKIADIQAAFEFLSSREGIGDISGLGICAGAGYMAHAVAKEPRFSSLMLVAPWLHDEAMARGIYDMRPGGSDGLIAASREADRRWSDDKEMTYVLAASELDPLSAMYVPGNIFDYYLNPALGAGPSYDNRFAVASWEPWITFDGISAAESIEQPVHVVHSEQGAVPDGTKRFLSALKGPKTSVWLNDYGQMQFYFDAPAVDGALTSITKFMKASATRQ